MLREITIGQFYPANSVIHRLDPRVKLFATMVFIITLFNCDNVALFVMQTFALGAIIVASTIPFKYLLKGLKAIFTIVIIAGLMNLFMTPGEVLFSKWIFTITKQGLSNTLLMTYRMVYLIMGTSILTLTTTPNQLTDGLEKSLHFLTVLKVPVHEIAMMMSIALRFIPILIEETDKIMKAQTARGAQFDTGGIIKKAKAMIPVLVPLFVSAFRRANDLALAMEARCYNGGQGRTRMKPLVYRRLDRIAYFVMALYVMLYIVIKILL